MHTLDRLDFNVKCFDGLRYPWFVGNDVKMLLYYVHLDFALYCLG